MAGLMSDAELKSAKAAMLEAVIDANWEVAEGWALRIESHLHGGGMSLDVFKGVRLLAVVGFVQQCVAEVWNRPQSAGWWSL